MKVVRTEIPNPMNDPETRLQVSLRHKELGLKPPIRGGNGTGMTVPQRQLLTELMKLSEPQAWLHEFAVSNGRGSRIMGLPTHYKIDLAMPSQMLAVEVDGGSHSSLIRQASDARKDEVLTGRGWTVLRFSNKVILKSPEKVAQKIMSTLSR